MMKKNILLISVIVLFFLDLYFILSGCSKGIDSNIAIYFANHNNIVLINIFKFISFICSPKFMILVNVCLLIFIILKKKYKLFLINIASIVSVIVNNILKIIIKRERPNFLALVSESSYSFPSGHSMISILFFGSIIYLVNKYNIKYKKTITILLSIFIILVGLSRLYLGVHFLTDVIGGYLCGFIALIIIIMIFERVEKK